MVQGTNDTEKLRVFPARKEPPLRSISSPIYRPMPLSSPSPIYDNLINLLHPSPSLPQILELDILPSSYPSTLYSSPPSLALPKPLLARLFVIAHTKFFTYVISHTGVQSSVEDEGTQERLEDEGSPTDQSYQSGEGSPYIAALSATRVLLLWDPNHITAANFRKRHLLLRSKSKAVSIPNSQSTVHDAAHLNASFLALLRSELSFLTSLVTSPLSKAPKASTLWAHRLWLLRSFHTGVLMLFQKEQVSGRESGKWMEEGAEGNSGDRAAMVKNEDLQTGESTLDSANSALQHLYTRELQTVMRAADRHPRNYYAWGYARALFTHLTIIQPSKHPTPTSPIPSLSSSLALSILPSIHNWCMTHPRDISGWTFLLFLIQRLGLELGLGPEPTPFTSSGFSPEDIDLQNAAKREVDGILRATTEAAEKFAWRGESVRWFLRSLDGGFGGELGEEVGRQS